MLKAINSAGLGCRIAGRVALPWETETSTRGAKSTLDPNPASPSLNYQGGWAINLCNCTIANRYSLFHTYVQKRIKRICTIFAFFFFLFFFFFFGHDTHDICSGRQVQLQLHTNVHTYVATDS